MSENEKGERRTSRRAFLGGAAVGLAGGAVATGTYVAYDRRDDSWDEAVDIAVVGGGAAGCAAALMAHELGKQVIILEKGPSIGGTAAKSVGGVWVPGNRWMSEAGISDERQDCLRYMVRLSFPDVYDPQAERFGASQAAFRLLETYFDNAKRVTEKLEALGALKLVGEKFNGAFMPDYFAHIPENKAPVGRCLFVGDDSGKLANGAEMMRRFAAALESRGVEVRKRTPAAGLVLDEKGGVVGLTTDNGEGETRRIRTRHGVIFATGGFTHDTDMRRRFLKGPVFGGCAVPTNQGDFVKIASGAGVQLGNMQHAWWAQIPLDQALENPSVPTGIWCTPGDSVIQVNRMGERFFNEKFVYNERTQAHFAWDPVSATYPNLLSFMIYDARSAEQYAGFAPIPPKGSSASHVIEAGSLNELTRAIESRLREIGAQTGGYSLASEFETNLSDAIDRFNRFAKTGKDEDFARGAQPIDKFFHFFGPGKPENPLPNPTMHPLSAAGPYYAIILAAGTLDTKGGPVTDEKARVLNTNGHPISGLFAAGNCSAGCAGPAYWAGGATLGPALTFGVIAAETAAAA